MATIGRPRILLVSSWQTVNIGDVAHAPGALAAIRRFAPNAAVTLWAWRLGDRERALLAGHFPDVTVIEGGPSAELPAELIDSHDILLHGSAPSLVADVELQSWRRRTTKAYGFFGVTIDPIAPHHPFTLAEAEVMVPAVAGDLLPAHHRELLSGAAFVHCRDSLSRRFLAEQGIADDRLSFGPDATLAFDAHDVGGAERILASHGLAAGEFLCVLPRLRFAPYHQMNNVPPTADQIRKDAYNAGHVEADLSVLRQVVINWVRDSGRDVFVVPEMAYVVDLAAARMTTWPDDVARHVRVLDHFWSLPEASAVYARAAAVVSMDCHSPLLATAVDTPALYLRLPTETVKGRMYADLGADQLVHEISPNPSPLIREQLQGIAADPVGSRAAVRQLRACAEAGLQRMVSDVVTATSDRQPSSLAGSAAAPGR